MQERVTKGIITASYDDDGKHGPVKDKVMGQIQKEKEKGYKFLNHVFLRDTGAHRVTKFNFPLAGIPIIAYTMFNAARTSLERIAVVGDELTEGTVEAFSDYFQDDRFTYVNEGDSKNWTMSETFRRGKDAVKAEEGEVSLVLMGDLPFAWNLEHLLIDPDIADNDAVLDLNTRGRVGLFFPRYYHLRIKHRGHWFAKEPNLYLMDVEKILPIADMIYSGRKTNMNQGRRATFERLFVNDGRWLGTLKGMGPRYAAETAFNLAAGRRPLLKPDLAREVIENALGLRVKFKADNDDPGTLEDVDSLEDWAYLSEMLMHGEDTFYPYFTRLRKFSEDVMPTLREKFDFYDSSEEYMNSLFKEYGLPEPFVLTGVFKNPFRTPRVKRMIWGNILYHRKYNRKYSEDIRE